MAEENEESSETSPMLLRRDTSVQTIARYSFQEKSQSEPRRYSIPDTLCSKLSSRPNSICKSVISTSDYDLTQACSGSDYHTPGDDSSSIRKCHSLSSLSTNSENSSVCELLRSSSNDTVKKSTNSISSTTKSSTISLCSQEEFGTADITPVLKTENICHIVCSSELQRGGLKENKCYSFFFTFTYWLGISLCFYAVLLLIHSSWHSELLESVNYGPAVPHYVSAFTMILCGSLTVISSFKRHRFLIILILLLSIVCTLFCTLSLCYLSIEVRGRFTKLQDCSFDDYDKICSCYLKSGDEKKLFRFAEVTNCGTVQKNLKELIWGVASLFAFGFLISLFTTISSCYLLYKDRQNRLRRTSFDRVATSMTTQTQESSFTSPRGSFDFFSKNDHKRYSEGHVTLTTRTDVNNFSVGTQTPAFMMSVTDLIYEVNSMNNDYLELLIEDEPPPCYNDAIASLKS